MKLSAAEQHLIDFAREEFGERLADFFLAGLGEDVTAQNWHFNITYTDEEGAKLKRRIEVITYEPLNGKSCLPRRRDPLVLLALFHLLLHGDHIAPNRMRFKQEDVLSLLGWKGTPKDRRNIDEALKRYFLLTFKWEMNKSELKHQGIANYSSQETMLTEHEIIEANKDDGSEIERIVNRVVFNENFIQQLQSRSLFDINWNSILEITYT
jgi:hypothetical protein